MLPGFFMRNSGWAYIPSIAIEKYKKFHPCQIIVNGVIASLKYYMRLISNPQGFVDEYTKWLEFEFQRVVAASVFN